MHLPERNFARHLHAEHNHPRGPEKDNVEAGHQQGGRIKRAHIGRIVRPTERRKRPQTRAEPSVENVGILLEPRRPAVRALPWYFARDDETLAIAAMPRRYPM